MPGTYSQILLHVVFSTKDRAPWIATKVAERLYPYMGGILSGRKGASCTISAALKIMCISISAGDLTARSPT